MFDLGMGEVILLAIITLVVMGPEKFPEFAKIALRAFRDFRGYIDDIKHEVASEIKPVKEGLSQLAKHNPEEYLEKISSVLGDAQKTNAPESDTERFPYPQPSEAEEPEAQEAEPRDPPPSEPSKDLD